MAAIPVQQNPTCEAETLDVVKSHNVVRRCDCVAPATVASTMIDVSQLHRIDSSSCGEAEMEEGSSLWLDDK